MTPRVLSPGTQPGTSPGTRRRRSTSVATSVPPAATSAERAIARPSPLPPASSERASSRRVNGSKMRSRISAGIGRAVVGDGELDVVAAGGDVDGDRRRGVALGVVEQVAHDLGGGVAVGGDGGAAPWST